MSNSIVSQNVVVIPESVKDQLKKEVSEAFPGVVVTINNLNIWVSGDTKPIKDELKAFGFKWAPKRKAWFMRVPDNAKPYDGYQEQPEEQPEEQPKEQPKELTEDQQKLVAYYREYAKHLRSVTVCFENVKNFLNGWQKPINKTFVDRMLELINGISEREGMGKFYASWNCYNPKQLNAYYYPSNSYHYSIAGLSLLVESKTQKLTAEGKKILLETIDENIKHQADRAEQYERMADSYAEYLEAKKQRDDAIAEANEAFNANKTFTDCETDAQYNSNYGKYNYLF